MDDYEDEFEEYNDEFEEAEKVVPVKVPEKVVKSESKSESKNIFESKAGSSSVKQQSTRDLSPTKKKDDDDKKDKENELNKAAPKVVNINGNSKNVNNVSSTTNKYSMSLADSLRANPRKNRMKRLIENHVLEMQEEKFNHLNILPCSLLDIYYRKLKVSSVSTSSTMAALDNHSNLSSDSSNGNNNGASIKQIGTSTREESREIETMTEEIIMKDEEMQFSCGSDDTILLSLMQEIRLSKTSGKKKNNNQNQRRFRNQIGMGNKSQKEDFDFNVPTNLSSFLQRSLLLCESFLDIQEKLQDEKTQVKKPKRSEEKDGSDSSFHQGLFENDSEWVKFAEKEKKSMNELIVNRKLVCLKVSHLRPDLVMTAHAFPTKEKDIEGDLKPFKGIYCVWDLAKTQTPIYILENTGQPVDCCFSSTQPNVITAATSDGVISLWNLAESASIHKDKDSTDLCIDKGIRKPCFNTVYHGSNISLQLINGNDCVENHIASITQIESIGHGFGIEVRELFSQFVSMDISGKVIFWITKNIVLDQSSNNFENSVSESIGLSPWGSMYLQSVRVINVSNLRRNMSLSNSQNIQPQVNNGKKTEIPKSTNEKGNLLLMNNYLSTSAVFGIVPLSVAQVYVSSQGEEVCKIDRFDQDNTIKLTLKSKQRNAIKNINNGLNVTKIAIRENIISLREFDNNNKDNKTKKEKKELNEDEKNDNSSEQCEKEQKNEGEEFAMNCNFVLIGRSDGSVDLYADKDQRSYPLHSWQTTIYDVSSSFYKEKDRDLNPLVNSKQKIVMLKWCPYRASAFFAVNGYGSIFFFDLSRDISKPLRCDILPAEARESNLVDISVSRYTRKSVSIVTSFNSSLGLQSIQSRTISTEELKLCPSQKQLVEEDYLFRTSLSTWAGHLFASLKHNKKA